MCYGWLWYSNCTVQPLFQVNIHRVIRAKPLGHTVECASPKHDNSVRGFSKCLLCNIILLLYRTILYIPMRFHALFNTETRCASIGLRNFCGLFSLFPKWFTCRTNYQKRETCFSCDLCFGITVLEFFKIYNHTACLQTLLERSLLHIWGDLHWMRVLQRKQLTTPYHRWLLASDSGF